MQEKLRWHVEYQADPERWRREWASAFRNRVGHVIRTSDKLADALAGLARRIRDRAIEAMNTESDRGSLKRLLKAFQESLIHDLDEERFADTYAQTVTYGLLTAAFSRTEMSEGRHGTAFEAEDITHMVPVTNPFLKEMLGAFLTVGGRKGKIDFDELGIGDVVDLLKGDETDLPAIMADFGNKTRGEDPVIHFYEHFLAAYNKKLKVQRGVFYTPQPVVSYIVRSVHELLQTEFGLEDGLASTVTWGEMLGRLPDLKLPTYPNEKGKEVSVSKDEPFVLILDPATGTATFIVETIDVIYRHLTDKWKKARMSDAQRAAAWNDYVPKHLLPRLFAYELMMAPYAIAHMKMGLKLAETGYQFGSDERVRIYLTNALEPAQQQLRLPDFEPLAHEAEAVNRVKREKRFTVVIGNPPYSVSSWNTGEWIKNLAEDYKRTVRAEESQIQSLSNDYIKFLRFGEWHIEQTNIGIIGLITGHGYLSGTQARDLRNHLSSSFNRCYCLDLHGSIRRAGTHDSEDEPVFEIMTGVAIFVGYRALPHQQRAVTILESLTGLIEKKLTFLRGHTVTQTALKGQQHSPSAPYYYYAAAASSQDISNEYQCWPDLSAIFGTGNRQVDKEVYWATGFASQQDEVAMSFSRAELEEKMAALANSSSFNELKKTYRLCTTNQWNYDEAKEFARRGQWKEYVSQVAYRPFDRQWTVLHKHVLTILRKQVMSQFKGKDRNIGLISSRAVNDLSFAHCFVTDEPVDKIFISSKTSTNAYVFPLFFRDDDIFAKKPRPNLGRTFLTLIAEKLGLKNTAEHGLPAGLSPEDIFNYAYAVFHSPGYRTRYAEFLKIDFPRLPLTESLDLFRELGRLGGELVALHLLESKLLENPRTTFMGSRDLEIQKISFENDTVFIDKAQTSGFKGVPVNVWNFHIGGYQVCEKWLKDRKGRTLSDEDIAHYHKIVISLKETIRLMAEIDQVIEQHGGWPGAFATTKPPAGTPDQPAPSSPKAKAKSKPSAPHNDLGLHLEGELPL